MRNGSGSPPGQGNNGGDGLEAAIMLKQAGRDVRVTLCGEPTRLPPDASDALGRAQAAGLAIGGDSWPEFTRSLAPHDLAIDALLGLGASRAPQGRLAALIGELSALACPVLAVDLPSGLDAHTGQPLGDGCVEAAHTLALLTLKPGLYHRPGARCGGRNLVRRSGRGSRPSQTGRLAHRRRRRARDPCPAIAMRSTRAASATLPSSVARPA